MTGEGLASETCNRCPAGTYRGHDARLHVSVSGSLTTIGETAHADMASRCLALVCAWDERSVLALRPGCGERRAELLLDRFELCRAGQPLGLGVAAAQRALQDAGREPVELLMQVV